MPAPAAARVQAPVVGAETIAGLNWESLETMVRDCRRCPLCENRKNTVFGEGSHRARLMFVGEGPGVDEDLQGKPFVGASGQLLTKMIQAMQLKREDVYLASIVKCHAPRNRVPEKDEAAACLPYLNRQIQLLKPEVLVLLGATPLQYLLNLTGITRQRGQWHEYLGIPTLPTFHPAYLLRSPAKKREAWADLQQVMAKLGIRA
jgi:DNA polymerase